MHLGGTSPHLRVIRLQAQGLADRLSRGVHIFFTQGCITLPQQGFEEFRARITEVRRISTEGPKPGNRFRPALDVDVSQSFQIKVEGVTPTLHVRCCGVDGQGCVERCQRCLQIVLGHQLLCITAAGSEQLAHYLAILRVQIVDFGKEFVRVGPVAHLKRFLPLIIPLVQIAGSFCFRSLGCRVPEVGTRSEHLIELVECQLAVPLIQIGATPVIV